MQNSVKLLMTLAASAQAAMKPGACPDRAQNKPIETFNAYSMAGLWYEYVWDASFQQDYEYVCSTWIVLSDEAEAGPGMYQVYNNMMKDPEGVKNEETGEVEKDSEFIRMTMKWDAATDAGQKARAFLSRKDDEDEKVAPEQALNIIDTDYHQYVVGSSCHEADGQHEESFFVWMREKQPSMYMRRRARNALLALGLSPESMAKGANVECWGKDILM